MGEIFARNAPPARMFMLGWSWRGCAEGEGGGGAKDEILVGGHVSGVPRAEEN